MEAVAVYRLGKLVDKYTICYIVGFAGSREEVGKLLMGASRKLRKLLQHEFPIFVTHTEEPEILELKEIHVEYFFH